MARKTLLLVVPCLVLLSLSLNHNQVTAYEVKYNAVNNATNHPGGKRYEEALGKTYTLNLMKNLTTIIWKVFKQSTDADRRHVPAVTVYITDFPGEAWGYTAFPDIEISASRLVSFPKEATKGMFSGLMLHEMTHVFQWSGEGTAPGGLTEGFAEYVKLKAGYGTTAGPGDGEKWDEGYGVTARFLEYCDSLKPGFGPDLNKKMRKVFKESYFQEMLGKPLNQLWKDYKAKYGHRQTTPHTVSMVPIM